MWTDHPHDITTVSLWNENYNIFVRDVNKSEYLWHAEKTLPWKGRSSFSGHLIRVNTGYCQIKADSLPLQSLGSVVSGAIGVSRAFKDALLPTCFWNVLWILATVATSYCIFQSQVEGCPALLSNYSGCNISRKHSSSYCCFSAFCSPPTFANIPLSSPPTSLSPPSPHCIIPELLCTVGFP